MRLRRTCNEKSHTPGSRSARLQMLLPLLCALLPVTEAVHHMKRPPRALVNRENDNRPLMISNQCPEVIYPGVGTQAGVGPPVGGFRLGPGETRNFTVSGDWQGRVWGRTNCTFNADGTGPDHSGGNNGGGAACGTGDCGGVVNCKGTVKNTYLRYHAYSLMCAFRVQPQSHSPSLHSLLIRIKHSTISLLWTDTIFLWLLYPYTPSLTIPLSPRSLPTSPTPFV